MLEMTMAWSGSEVIELLKEDLRRRGLLTDGHFSISLGEHPPFSLHVSTTRVRVKYAGEEDSKEPMCTCKKDKLNPYKCM